MRVCKNTIGAIREFARNGRVVVFDTETTGGTKDDEICQIAAAEYVAGTFSRTMNTYLCPTCDMNPWAESIHGLSMDFLQVNGIAPEEAMRQFFGFVGDRTLLVAHNLRFDMGMVQNMCRKFDLDFEPELVETCDTLALARHLRPGLGSYRLCNLIPALGIEGCNSHDALDDTMACAGIFFKLLAE